MAQITRFLCFALCTFVSCKSKHVEKTWLTVNDGNKVTITLSNRQNVQSYANFQTYETGIHSINFVERHLYNFMEDFFSNIQRFSRLSPQNPFPYFFIIPKFSNRNYGFYNLPNSPDLFQTPAVPTSTSTPNKVEPFITNRPQASGTRKFQVEIMPTLRSRTFVTQDTTTPTRGPITKISTTTNVNTESPETTTVEPQEASTTPAEEDDGQFFDDEDDTIRPITFRDTKTLKSDRRLDKKLRKMPEVEHGSVQAGM